jgi:hypothetical protein
LPTKDPVKVKAGRIGAEKRWTGHEPVVIRLADIEDAELRAAYLALHKLGVSRKAATPDAA